MWHLKCKLNMHTHRQPMAVSQALTLHERDGKGPMFEPDLAARPVPQPDSVHL